MFVYKIWLITILIFLAEMSTRVWKQQLGCCVLCVLIIQQQHIILVGVSSFMKKFRLLEYNSLSNVD